MNDRHPSGTATTPAPASDAASAPYAPYGGPGAAYGDFTTYGDYDANGFPTGAHTTTAFATDPLFGELSGHGDTGTGAHGTAHWTTGSHQPLHHDAYPAAQHAVHDTGAYATAAYDTGAWDTAAWADGRQTLGAVPQQGAPVDATGQWDAHAWQQPDAPAPVPDGTQQWEWGTQAFDTGTFDTGAFASATFDTGAFDAAQWNSDGAEGTSVPEAFAAYEHQGEAAFDAPATAVLEQAAPAGHDEPAEPSAEEGDPAGTGELPTAGPLLEGQEEVTPSPRAAARAASRSRRRPPARRSALLTVAVPSACVMGVAGIAAASVGSLTDDTKDTAASVPDAHAVQPSAANNKLDSQLQSLSAGADDFADRASRTQQRIDLRAQQVAAKKKAAEDAARKERLRPKFVLPVTQRGLSAYFGQAGVNWMSVHTGIDFPVSYGTTVMSAIDGTARTQWNSAYGNMLIVTGKDGTETWYCHLSSYRVASGTPVKAGQPVAYSGNSGNSTGPHLHFEVRPAGGPPVDPLPWLRSHGLDPT
ncbi:peptidoglycan DD-metalloendopeptidase family protein [Streptomyces tropicalis]|uniref:Peptidoglycan DD-metalloendopeptidase family protein n=1 Tax=Streptomyces tropicalis TaxID=3034234 RepID=A0ABT6AB80_9ACTN|nr:peptidoglycan DD-metalloendopeptidase family protein [Streptomyces tropicalis]MDF3301070.1 peptidoglycan DD-metalloendopeptidase family protein [Streptomyces tropicalis]